MPSVLIVDDSKTVQTALSSALRADGFEVVVSENFISIPKIVAQTKPAAIVLDLNMPALSGEQIGKFLQRQGYQGKVIIYSGEKQERLHETAESVGAFAVVHKDQPMTDLVAVVRACTENAESSAAVL